MGLSRFILSIILVPVLELLFSSPVFEGVFEVTSVHGAAPVVVAPFAVLQVVLPLPFVVISLYRFPKAETILLAKAPLPFIALSVPPDELATSVSLAHLV
jgi:hypothetical protein